MSTEDQITLRAYLDVRLSAIEREISKAESATDHRLDSLNEMRGMVVDATRTYLPRLEYESAYHALVDKVEAAQKMLWIGLGVILALQFLASIMLVVWTHGK